MVFKSAYIFIECYTLKSAFDFGGQEQYRKEYMEKPEIFRGTDVLVCIVDLHDPDTFDHAKEYFDGLLDIHRKNNEKPKVLLFLHKYDTEKIDY